MRRLLVVLAFLPACVIDAPTYHQTDGGAGTDGIPDPCPVGFAVSGTVDGLWDPAAVALHLDADGTTDQASVETNRAFTFEPCLTDGASYAVTVETQPPQHECLVFGGTGTIDGADVSGVRVACTGPIDVNVTLSLPINWIFSSSQTSYTRDVSLLAQEMRITATATGADAVTVNGQGVGSGMPSDRIPLGVGSNSLPIVVNAGAFTRTYSVEINRGNAVVEQHRMFKSTNPDTLDYYGYAVAGDDGLVAAGAYGEDSSTTGIDPGFDEAAMTSGAVYVTQQQADGVTWLRDAFVKASNTSAGDFAGQVIAMDEDTMVVGAVGAGVAGAAYVFRRSNGAWTEEAILTPAHGDAVDYFGVSVAISGDAIVVGAYAEDSNATGVNGDELDNSEEGTGAAYVFRRTGTSWQQEAYFKPDHLVPPDGLSSEYFGWSVAISGDTVAVSATGDDSGATGIDGDSSDTSINGSGAVYVFRKDGNLWAQEAYVKASNPGAGDRFGKQLALDGDVLAVGAEDEDSFDTGVNGTQTDNSASGSGAVYVFRRTSSWAQEAYLKASNTGIDDGFGSGLALRGDLLAVGAGGESSAAPGVDGDESNDDALYSGAAYLFRWSGEWDQVHYIKATNPGASDGFGGSLALTGNSLLIGAGREDSGSSPPNESLPDSGAAYLFR